MIATLAPACAQASEMPLPMPLCSDWVLCE